jgi:hypothetical protein
MLRRLALLELAIGAFVSLASSGRLSVRLIVDGAISFAFIPVLEIAAFWIVDRVAARSPDVRFRDRLSQFLAGNRPWLLWLAICGGVLAVLPPRRLTLGFVRVLELSAVLPFVWSWWSDARFFRAEAGGRRGHGRALAVRAIAWPLGVAYFLGIAIWSLVEPHLAGWMR